MKNKVILYLLILLHFYALEGQSLYNLSYKKEIPLFSVGILSGGVGQVLKSNKAILTQEQIGNLDRNNVWKMERFVTHNWRPSAALRSDFLLWGSHAFPLLIFTHKQARQNWQQVGIMGAEAYLLNVGLTGLVKEIFKRKRPYLYNTHAPLSKKQTTDATSSFFSGHTSVVAANSFFTAFMLTQYSQNNKHDALIWVGAATVPALTAALRVRAGKHFPTDVAVGYVVGALSGVLVPLLHRK